MGDPRLIISPHVVPGRWLLQGGTVGGGVLRWLQQVFALQGTGTPPDFDRMNDLAASIPAGGDGLVLLPYLAGERSRYGMRRPWACSMAWTIAPPART